MGELAQADIWARQNGRLNGIVDMTPDDWIKFYGQYDDKPRLSKSRMKCPTCGKKFKSRHAVGQHHVDYHKKPLPPAPDNGG